MESYETFARNVFYHIGEVPEQKMHQMKEFEKILKERNYEVEQDICSIEDNVLRYRKREENYMELNISSAF